MIMIPTIITETLTMLIILLMNDYDWDYHNVSQFQHDSATG